MKILHLISGGDTGGARTHVLNLLGELNKAEDVLLLCLREGVMSREARMRGIPCTVLTGGFFAQLRQVGDTVRSGSYALLHCHGSRANLTGVLLKKRLPVPVISTVHSDPRLDYLRRPVAGLLYGTANRFALRRMDALVAVSENMKATLSARGIPEERIFTLYNGQDLSREPVRADRRCFLSDHGIAGEENALYVGCAARLDPVKDLPTLLRGFAMALEKEPRLRLLLAGSGSEEAKLHRLCRELGISHRVHFLGWVNDMAGFYSAVDINALSSLYETFPYSLTEGARYGIPAVAASVGGIPELMEDGRCGFLVSPGDASGFARAILTLCGDEALRHSMGNALRERITKCFSLRAMGERQLEIYGLLPRSRTGILIVGACGMGNPGDEAMLSVILSRIRSVPVTVVTHDGADTASRFGVNAVSRRDPGGIRRAMKGSCLLLCGGGNLLQDVTSRRSLLWYLALIRLGKRLGCRVVLFGNGLGPLSPGGLRRTVKVLNDCVSLAVFRDEDSLRAGELAGLTLPETAVSADPALALPIDALPEAEEVRRKYALPDKVLLLSLCPWRGMEKKAGLLIDSAGRWAERRGFSLLLLPLTESDAVFMGKLRDHVPMLPVPDSPEEVMALLRCGEAILSSRLHGLVFARRLAVPCAGIACDGRIRSFMGAAGLPWEEYASVTDSTAERLLDSALVLSSSLRPEEKAALELGLGILDREVDPHG